MSRSDLIDGLTVRLIGAPMAGGPSTPALAAAVSGAGGLGMLAAGYRTADDVQAQIEATARLTTAPGGVNVFVPEVPVVDAAALAAFGTRLRPWAERLGLPEPAAAAPDLVAERREASAIVDVCTDMQIPLVTFTFGLPEADWVHRLRDAGREVGITVSGPEEAAQALALEPDVLIVQGPEAGGHRGTLVQERAGDPRPVAELIVDVRAMVGRAAKAPALVAAGGAVSRRQVQDLLRDADAVQIGTALLATPEAGTRAEHRDVLLRAAADSDSGHATSVTRVFTGRRARALRNAAIDALTDVELTAYPHVHLMTAGLRRAETDPQWLHLWAGTGHRSVREAPAAQIIAELAP